jgi:hypothetical protein
LLLLLLLLLLSLLLLVWMMVLVDGGVGDGVWCVPRVQDRTRARCFHTALLRQDPTSVYATASQR